MSFFPTSAGSRAGQVTPAPSSTAPNAPIRAPGAVEFARLCKDEALVEDWKRLETCATLPMQSHAFAVAISYALLAGSIIQVFVTADAEGIAALLPLCRDQGRFARWRIIGAREVYEPNDALCRNPDSMRLLAEAIAGQGRALRLDRIPAGSPLIAALRRAMRGRGWVSARPAVPSPTITLGRDWEDPESRFNSGRRSDFRRALRKADEFGRVAFEIVSPEPDGFDGVFDEAIGVEGRSWKREAGTALAVDRSKEQFFRDFFRAACEAGTFRLAVMRIDGEIVAMQMALESLDRYWLFKIGFDQAFGRCSPGSLLMLHTIGWAAKRGLLSYELLGNVEPWIAQFWTQEQRDCVRLHTYPFNARGAVAFAADAFARLRKSFARGTD